MSSCIANHPIRIRHTKVWHAHSSLVIHDQQGESEIIHLQEEVVRRLERLGTTLERRPFHPHLTLARWRTSRPADRRLVPTVESRAVARLTVDRVTLYQSRLSAAGPAYTALARATLT